MPSGNILLVLMPPFWPKMPHLGLGCLQAFLEQKGLAAEILDLNNLFYNLSSQDLKKEWLLSCNVYLEENILRLIENNFGTQYRQALEKMLDYDTVGFSCSKSNFLATLEVVELLRKRRKDIRIVLGGSEITRQFFKGKGTIKKEFRQLADFLVVGEGETPLFNYLAAKGKFDKVAAFQQLANLGGLNFPRYQGLNFSDYPRKDAVALQLSRGCIGRCCFCSERLLYKGFRARNQQSVIEEIKYHKQNNHTDYFIFFDSLLNADLTLLEELCDKIIDNFGSFAWEAQMVIRSDMSEQLLKKMKKSGCYNLFIGLESGSAVTLKRMHKGFSPDEASRFFTQLNSAGLAFGISVIVGYPGESAKNFQESLDFVLRHQKIIPKIEQVNPFTYYDGTGASQKADYKLNKSALSRWDYFLRQIKQHDFRYTNAFLGNLIEKDGRV